MICTQCGEDIDESNASFCPSCGAPVAHVESVSAEQASETATLAFCSECGKPLEAGSVFCPSCGAFSGDDTSEENDMRGSAPTEYVAPFLPAVAKAASAETEKKSLNKGLVIGIISALIVAAAALGIALFVALNQPSSTTAQETTQTGSVTREGKSETDAVDTTTKSQEQTPQKDSSSSEAPSSSKNEATTNTPNKSDGGKSSSKPTAGYILADSTTRYYSTSELSRLSDWELYLARNEVYARHGRGFDNEDLARYFNNQNWYSQRYTPSEFDAMDSPLNDYERKNADEMMAIETSRNSPYLVP